MPIREESVQKASGEFEPFNRKKILGSLLSSGVPHDEAEDIIEKVLITVRPPVTTKKLFRAVKKFLRSSNITSTIKYSLKSAMFALGPSGYPFERFVARVLDARGYKTEVGQIVPGYCVDHEVDVVARRDDTCYMVECKFHHSGKTNSNIKTALYVHARVRDIVRGGGACSESLHKKGMLVTNTRFSSEAVKYAECVGLRVIAWKYPKGASLENMIDTDRTFPVTVLPSARREVLVALLRRDIVLAADILHADHDSLVRDTGLDPKVIRRLKAQASEACSERV